MKKRKLLALCLVPALLAGCAAPAGVTDLSRQFEAGDPRPRRPTRRRTPPSAPWGRSCCGRPANRGEHPALPAVCGPGPVHDGQRSCGGHPGGVRGSAGGGRGGPQRQRRLPCWLITPPWGGSTECSIADSLWLDGRLEANELFLSRCTAFYGARLYQADLDTDRARRAVNNWVGEVTRGLIPEVLAETPAPETVLLLVNALYLKNAWASEFDPLDTRPGDFTAADGSEAETDFLSNGLRAEQYFAAGGAAGVVLPYDDGRLGFLAVLPDGELDAWLETLDGDTPARPAGGRGGGAGASPAAQVRGGVGRRAVRRPGRHGAGDRLRFRPGRLFRPGHRAGRAAVRQFCRPQGPHRGQREGHRGCRGHCGGGRGRGRAHRLPGAGARPAPSATPW